MAPVTELVEGVCGRSRILLTALHDAPVLTPVSRTEAKGPGRWEVVCALPAGAGAGHGGPPEHGRGPGGGAGLLESLLGHVLYGPGEWGADRGHEGQAWERSVVAGVLQLLQAALRTHGALRRALLLSRLLSQRGPLGAAVLSPRSAKPGPKWQGLRSWTSMQCGSAAAACLCGNQPEHREPLFVLSLRSILFWSCDTACRLARPQIVHIPEHIRVSSWKSLPEGYRRISLKGRR